MVREGKNSSEKERSSSRSSRKRKLEKEANKERSYKDRSSGGARRHTSKDDDERDYDRGGGHKRRRHSGHGSREYESSDRRKFYDHTSSSGRKRDSRSKVDKESKPLNDCESKGKAFEDTIHKVDKASCSGAINGSKAKEDDEFIPTAACGTLATQKTVTYYRSNLRTAIKEINSVRYSDSQLRAIKKTPFWFLFEAIYDNRYEKLMEQCHKYESDILQIVQSCDVDAALFDIGGHKLKITSNDVKLILGVSCGSTLIPPKPEQKGTPRWVKRCFAKQIKERKNLKIQFVVCKPQILRRIGEMFRDKIVYEESVDDMARLVHCYLLASFLAPSQNGSISCAVADYAEDLSKICSYDWCEYIVDWLHSQLKSGMYMRTGGCVTLLPFWLCEHTKIVEPIGDHFPRFLNWDMPGLHSALRATVLSSVANVRRSIRSATDREQDKLQRLKEVQNHVVLGERAIVRIDDPDSNNNSTYYDCVTLSDDEVVEPTADGKPCVDAFVGVDRTVQEDEDTSQDRSGGFEKHFNEFVELVDEPEAGDIAKKDKLIDGHKAGKRSGDGMDFSTSQFFNMGLDTSTMRGGSANLVIGGVIADLSTHAKNDSLYGGADQSNFGLHVKGDIGIHSTGYDRSIQSRGVQAEKLTNDVVKTTTNDLSVISMMKNEIDRLTGALESTRVTFDQEVATRNELIHSMQLEKYLMMKEMDEMRIKMEDDSSSLEGKLKLRDDRISILASENLVLSRKLEEMAIPSVTQVYNNPDNIAYMDALEKNAILTREIEILKAGQICMTKTVNAESSEAREADLRTPDDKGKLLANHQEPPTMIMVVKGRTDRDDRKRVEISPQLPTNELIRIHEGVVDVDVSDFDGGVEDSHPIETMKLNYSSAAVKKADKGVINQLERMMSTKGKNHFVWEGEEPLALVTVEHIVKILNHGRIDSNVIDAWGDIVHLKNKELVPSSKYTTVFSASCWDVINAGRAANPSNFECFVDNKLEESIDQDILLFPIHAKGRGRGLGNHWTLLRLNRRNCEWKFYNSNSSKANRVDEHLDKSLIVVKYVDKKLRQLYRKRSATHTLLQKKLVHPKPEACVQQLPESVDCGVVVCQLIEKFMLGQRTPTGQLGLLASGSYRARMVTDFVQTPSVGSEYDI